MSCFNEALMLIKSYPLDSQWRPAYEWVMGTSRESEWFPTSFLPIRPQAAVQLTRRVVYLAPEATLIGCELIDALSDPALLLAGGHSNWAAERFPSAPHADWDKGVNVWKFRTRSESYPFIGIHIKILHISKIKYIWFYMSNVFMLFKWIKINLFLLCSFCCHTISYWCSSTKSNIYILETTWKHFQL